MSPHKACLHARRIARFGVLIAVVCGSALAGCTLFDKPTSLTGTTVRKLPPLKIPPGSIQLDVVYVERPVGDPLLGAELWRHVDQVAAIETQTRNVLRRSGFRVGVVGANPPVPLQRMLGLKSDFAYEPDAEQAKQLVGRRIFLTPGGETDIQVSPMYPECSFNLAPGDPKTARRFESANCRYQVKAERLQDGWIRLGFVPQVHHGDNQLRQVAGDEGWRYQSGQLAETFFLQRFDVKLSTGEMAVITAEDDAPGSLGQLFFRGPAGIRRSREGTDDSAAEEEAAPSPENDYPVQRLLIVRLAGMAEMEKPFATSR